ncbi:hypothetical protein [uncultured Bacteroides sp.]|uniref:hypothetical protein n=1 Tax=uncultured Bacteroides sp. TaxID=162156 RepID=UPI00266FC454|nr:hypothetical protein [uncultured Bacteroides sp.]
MNKELINSFISYLNKDKLSNVVSWVWMAGWAVTMLDVFCLHDRFKLFTICFYYYVTPIVAVIIIVRTVMLFRKFKKMV